MRLLAPTLARRLLLALVGAFLLVFVVLGAEIYYDTLSADHSDALRARDDFAVTMSHVLHGYREPERVRTAAAVVQDIIHFQSSRAEKDIPSEDGLEARFFVWDEQGRQIYGSPGAPAGLAETAFRARTGVVEFEGRRHYAGRHEEDGMVVALVDRLPLEQVRTVVMRDALGQLLAKMAIAFPFVFLVSWAAVHGGLKPLRLLSRRLSNRAAGDFSPLSETPRYGELRPVVEALDGLLERQRGEVERERRFVHDAAHELQTPLAVVVSQVHALAHAEGAKERLEALARAEQAVERAARLVRQLLELARQEQSGPRPAQDVDVAQLARGLLASLAPRALARSVDLVLDSPDTLVMRGDPHALESILGNLVDNAIRYVPAGSHVRVELDRIGAQVQLRVVDDGPGIAPADRERVFDRFYRIPGGAFPVPGSGLGLAIVRQAAEACGGSVLLAEGDSGRGCSFTVRLPG